jgi:glutathione peroxidase
MVKSLIGIFAVVVTTSIYTLTASSIDGSTMNFSSFQGKKILIVNTATGSEYVSQYVGLEQLYQQYKDSLVIIAFPSNSFGHEPGSNASIDSFVNNTYHIHYILGAKLNVVGESEAAIYQWLTQQTQNGMLNSTVQGDFQKYLVDTDGKLIAVFSPDVDPMNQLVQNAITGN